MEEQIERLVGIASRRKTAEAADRLKALLLKGNVTLGTTLERDAEGKGETTQRTRLAGQACARLQCLEGGKAA